MQGNRIDPSFPVYVKNINLGKHGSDSGAYDNEGRCVCDSIYKLDHKPYHFTQIISNRCSWFAYIKVRSWKVRRYISQVCKVYKECFDLERIGWNDQGQSRSWWHPRLVCLKMAINMKWTVLQGWIRIACNLNILTSEMWFIWWCWRLAARAEWRVLYMLGRDKDGLLQKDTVRAVYDGTLFWELEKQHKKGSLGV